MSLRLLALLSMFACAPEPEGTAPVDDPSEDPIDDPIVDDEDTTPPSVVSITPADGARGVREDAVVVLTFSEAMDTGSVERSLDTRTLGEVGLSWNDERTELTVAPTRYLAYAYGEGIDPDAVRPNRYVVVVGTGATDEAGNPIVAGAQTAFDTLKSLTTTVGRKNELTGTAVARGQVSDADDYLLVGDDSFDVGYRSFVSFDLTRLPRDVVDVTAAWLHGVQLSEAVGTPYRELGRTVLLEHTTFDALDAVAFGAAPLGQASDFCASGDVGVAVDVAEEVADDLAHRAERAGLSQYRLRFAADTNEDGGSDAVILGREELELELSYLAP